MISDDNSPTKVKGQKAKVKGEALGTGTRYRHQAHVLARVAFLVATLRRHDNLPEDSRQLASLIQQRNTLLPRTEISRRAGSQPPH
jgi:hypothetical protein